MIYLRHVLTLVCLFGISHMASAQDVEAVERRLGQAINEGELTIAQAHAMMQALQGVSGDERTAMLEQGMKKRLDVVGRRLKEAVRTGRITEEQAEAEWARIEREADVIETGMKIRAAIARGELTKEEGRAKMDAVQKERERSHRERSDRERSGIEDHYRRMGVTGEVFKRVKAALKESGVTDKQIEPTLGGMLRVMHMIKSADADKMDAQLREYFTEEVGLKAEQIEVIQGLAARVVLSLKADDEHDDDDDDPDGDGQAR